MVLQRSLPPVSVLPSEPSLGLHLRGQQFLVKPKEPRVDAQASSVLLCESVLQYGTELG